MSEQEEIFGKRLRELSDLGLKFSFAENAYIRKDENLYYVPVLDIQTYTDKQWNIMIERMQKLSKK